MTPRITSIQVGRPADHQLPVPWRSAFLKTGVSGPVMLRRLNLDGDAQADLKNHGGPDQAVLCYSAGHYPAWSAELGRALPHGGFGENLTIDGLDETSVCLGDTYSAGETLVQVSAHRGPCYKIAYRWQMPELLELVRASGRTGWYLRVLCEGLLQAGEPFVRLERPNPDWPMSRVYRAWEGRHRDRAEAIGIAACAGAAADYAEGLARLAREEL